MTARVPVAVGDVLRLAEGDYKFGAGPLVLRVTSVGPVVNLADGPWLTVAGVELREDETPIFPEPRPATVRMSALRQRMAGS